MDTTNLAEVWTVLVDAGATVYEWTEQGISTGTEVVKIGEDHLLTVDDTDGYQVIPGSDIYGACGLVAKEEYDEDAAILAASDIEGWFGVVGRPGEQLHTFDWFATQKEAQAWCVATHDAIRANNPRLGLLECQTLATAEALDVKYLDGTRVYFRHRESGQGFVPRYSSV
jgi:hypothetical protein